MKHWNITYDNGGSTVAVGHSDIWSDNPGVSGVQEVAAPLAPPAPPAQPKTLEALDFIRHAAAQITPARVVAIEEAFRDHASADLRYAWKEYDRATSFTKEKVDEFLTAGVAASILTAQEKADVLGNWPT